MTSEHGSHAPPQAATDVELQTHAVPALCVKHLSKTFPGQRALIDLTFELAAGEVHALLGQNGSGKSTFVKLLSGYHQPDPGATAAIAGESFQLGDSAASETAGLRFVHQDLGLVLDVDAVENYALGHGYETGRGGRIMWSEEVRRTREALARLGYDIDVRRPLRELTMSERTGVAIARAIRGWEEEARVLVLDEVTASLPGPEVGRVFDVIRRLRAHGVAVIYVSHRLDEVFAIADRVTVLRDGREVATLPVAHLDHDALVEMIVGRVLLADTERTAESHAGEVSLELQSLSGRWLRDLSFVARRGEVIGIAGVTGSGREEVASLIFGDEARRGGAVLVDGRDVADLRPDQAVQSGIALVPAERGTRAALTSMTLTENLTLPRLAPFWKNGKLNKRAERAEVQAWLERFEIDPQDPDRHFSSLSGGNQQKVVVARWIRLGPKVLVLDEPTQGVDVGGKVAIHRFIDEAAAAGAAVVVCSTDTSDLERLCDTVFVLDGGEVVTTLRRPDATAAQIDQAMYSVGKAA